MSLLILFRGGAAPPSVCFAAIDNDDESIKYMQKNVASQNIDGQVNDRTTGAPLTSAVSIFVKGDSGAQAAGGGTLTHKGNGSWNYVPTQAETNFNEIAFTFTHATGVNKTYTVYTYSYDPHDTVRLGLTALPNAAAGGSGGVPVVGTGTNNFKSDGSANVTFSNTSIGTVTTTTNLTNLPSIPANWLTGSGLDASAVSEISTGVLTTQMTESYAADGIEPTLSQALYQIIGREYEFSISGDTLTVKKLDGTTTAMTFTLSPPGGPYTGITRAS